MGERKIRAALERHWAASDADELEAEHAIYREDAVLDFRSRAGASAGGGTSQAPRAAQPDRKRFSVRRITGAGAGVVHTTRGSFEAPIIVEAAGWRTSAPKGREAKRARIGNSSQSPPKTEQAEIGIDRFAGIAHGAANYVEAFLPASLALVRKRHAL